MFLSRGGGQVRAAGVAAVCPGGGAGEEVLLAAPAGDVELGLGEAAQPPPAGVVDRGAVLVELAGELADRGRYRFQDRCSRSRAVKLASLLPWTGCRLSSSWAVR